MMRGFFTTANADNDWKVSPKGLEFIKRYRAQPNTLGHNVSGTHVCNNATDDDGTYRLYEASLNNQAPFNCIGFNFSHFSADGYVFFLLWTENAFYFLLSRSLLLLLFSALLVIYVISSGCDSTVDIPLVYVPTVSSAITY